MSKYCMNCGNEVHEKAVICVKCGCAIPRTAPTPNQQTTTTECSNSILTTIAQRIKTDGIIWCVIGAVQILMGLLSPFTFVIGILNIASGYSDITYSQKVVTDPMGIVARMKPLVMPIITLAYNLFIGGVIGVIGSIYYFVAVRGYVLEHEQEFLEIENIHAQSEQ